MFIRLRRTLTRAYARGALRIAQPWTGLRWVDDTEPGDVFVVGFPKSGNTWVQYMLAGLVGGVDTTCCADSLVEEIVPFVDNRMAYRRYSRPVFFKSHRLPQPHHRRVVYLLRDGRDAMVSYLHHVNALHAPVDLPFLIRHAPYLDARWHEHVETWLANLHRAELMIVRYEELRRDPADGLRRIAEFAGLDVSAGQIERAAAGAAFDRQQAREATRGWDRADWPKDKPFIRRGVVGSFRDEMPAEALALFLAEAGPTLKKLGYSV